MARRQRGIARGEKADFVRFRWDAAAQQITVLQTVVAGHTLFERDAN